MTESTVVRKGGGVIVERERENKEKDRRTWSGQRAPGGSGGEKVGLVYFLL